MALTSPQQGTPFLGGWLQGGERRKGFDSLFFLVEWRLWKERNRRTFNGDFFN